ncbi:MULTISPECIES: BREX protein BrxB domain-containing protein [unclassified Oceanispirochaeta]|uniref:BREX protein BrxB domain-containing protein n=1 Tax=unclassified Oceanispirochaeta TaxID=2635722 RepID=UPI000E09375B|nr:MULTISPECIES: BREX protein BrxB domain-containing protein [unclassified Oceanispirochaeta]MBF9018896.1 DUF1788 domain-containing protein [Oceanispirochaeta sp. M2]NPD75395.1 DUF1788 domain-containing protein [Oceanispirochaeta sp. M1]RDG28758.1 DUF1788 domain-containing protein [Oceanispirochaeta sp. M1]
MSRLNRLVNSYKRHISIPWKEDSAAAQRVIFCVYNENEELRLRASIDEFEVATKETGNNWRSIDITYSFSEWLSSQRYAERYFEKPELISTLIPKLTQYITNKVENDVVDIDNKTVVAITGVASLFGFIKVKDLVDKIAPLIPGRLVIFFPGSYEDNNYRLLDGYDGWNYLAVPITADNEI